MEGIIIKYHYDGDYNICVDEVKKFFREIKGSKSLSGRLSYSISENKRDSSQKIHLMSWEHKDVQRMLEDREHYQTFSNKINDFAGTSLEIEKVSFMLNTSEINHLDQVS